LSPGANLPHPDASNKARQRQDADDKSEDSSKSTQQSGSPCIRLRIRTDNCRNAAEYEEDDEGYRDSHRSKDDIQNRKNLDVLFHGELLSRKWGWVMLRSASRAVTRI